MAPPERHYNYKCEVKAKPRWLSHVHRQAKCTAGSSQSEGARGEFYAAAVAVCLTAWQNGGGEAALQPLMQCKDLPLAVVLDSVAQVKRDILFVALNQTCLADFAWLAAGLVAFETNPFCSHLTD